MAVTTVPLTSFSEARITTFSRLGVECWAVGIYWADSIIAASTHMSYQGCVQWAYHQTHREKKDALTREVI